MPPVLLALAVLVAFSWPPAHGGAGPPVRERWRSWPVARVFPPSLPGTSPSGARVRYVLAGVAAEAPCARALQPAAARALAPLGCLTTLRATYTDVTETYVVTAGIAVLSDAATAAPPPLAGGLDVHGLALPKAGRHAPERPPTVLPAAFPGGPAERFGERQYVAGAVAAGYDRYVVLTAAGHADGRPYEPGRRADPRVARAARDLARALHRELTR
ncbi:hypothetical protein GCM10023259_073740 [Thermocatellispora tengchongensis]